MKQSEDDTKKQYIQIIKWIPVIKEIIYLGGEWKELKNICEPLGLNDTAFKDNPRVEDYLLNIDYWIEKIILNDR